MSTRRLSPVDDEARESDTGRRDVLRLAAAPRVVTIVSGIVLAAGVVMIVLGALRVGVTEDEPLHVERLRNYLDSGWYLNYGQLDHGRPAPNIEQQYVYGPVTMLLLHVLGVVVGTEDWHHVAVTANAYSVRHLGVAAISLLGLAAVAGTSRLLFRRWSWALVSASVMAAIPLWTGHSMFNVKDVSVATGCALVTLGLCGVARDEARAWALIRIGSPVVIFAGVVLAVGTRPGIWTAVAASCGALVLCRLLRPGSVFTELRRDLWRYRDIGIPLIAAWFVLLAVDPKAFASPWTLLIKSALGSVDFLGVRAPRSFVPVHVLMQVPVMILAFWAVGTVVAVRRVWRTRRSIGETEARLVQVLVQVFTLPLITVVHSAALYGDLRQLMFALPGTAVLATLGIARAIAGAQRATDKGVLVLAAGASCVAIVAPTIDQATLFPYNYVYYNPLSKAAGLQLTGDYYRASGRALVPNLPTTGRIVCSPEDDEEGRAIRVSHLEGAVDCAHDIGSPVAAYAEQRGWTDSPVLAKDEFWAITFGQGEPPKNCTPVHVLSRWTFWRRLRLAVLLRCEHDFPVLSPGTKKLDLADPLVWQLPDEGWLAPVVDQSKTGVRTGGRVSTMTFQLSHAFSGHAAVLTLGTTWDLEATVTFGGVPVQALARGSEGTGIRILLPKELVTRAVNEPTTLVMTSTTTRALDAKVVSVGLAVG